MTVFRRILVTAAAAAAFLMTVAAPASAHTQVTLEPAQAGASNVVMTVNGAAESDTAGISAVQMVLPAGISPDGVKWKDGPAGWTLAKTSDGFTASGPALPTGTAAKLSVTLDRLPPEPGVLVFKTLLTYSDGQIQRWIGTKGEDNPAPTVSVAPPAPGAVIAGSTPSSSASPTPTPTPAATEKGWDETPYWWLILGVLIVGGVGLAAYFAFGPRHGSNGA